MTRRKGLGSLPEIPANSIVPRSVVISTFSAAAVILHREARVAGAGAAFFISIAFHRGSAVLRQATTRYRRPANPEEDPEWVPNAVEALNLLAGRLPYYATVFEGYARALQWLADSSTYDSTPDGRGEPSQDPEPTTHAGELIVSQNHIALLNGLLDRPDCTATSRGDWALAACPYRVAFGGQWSLNSLKRATSTAHPAWVVARKNGRNTQYTLSDRGRAIAEGAVAANIRGRGAYHGMRGLLGRGQP